MASLSVKKKAPRATVDAYASSPVASNAAGERVGEVDRGLRRASSVEVIGVESVQLDQLGPTERVVPGDVETEVFVQVEAIEVVVGVW